MFAGGGCGNIPVIYNGENKLICFPAYSLKRKRNNEQNEGLS